MIRDKVFISYSHKDAKWKDQLVLMMQPFMEEGLELWSDSRIQPGQEWRDEINKALATTKVAVLLVSTHFLGSRFIKDHELPPLLEAAQRYRVTILCVLIDACCFEGTAIGKYQFAIDTKKTIKELQGAQRSKALKTIATIIKQYWETLTWTAQLGEDADAAAALQQLGALAHDFAPLAPQLLDRCIRHAMQSCYGPQAWIMRFPQLASKPQLNWQVILEFFGPACKPDPQLIDALRSQLTSANLPNDLPEKQLSDTHVALVVQWKGANARGKAYYTWKAFVHDPAVKEFKPIELSALAPSRQSVVFDRPGARDTTIASVLSALYAWIQRNTSLPVLEIFAPLDLLDAAWSDQVVACEDGEDICLLEALPYWLRSTDRLGEEYNSNRQRLTNKLDSLVQGNGLWSVGHHQAHAKALRTSIVEQDHVVGVKRFEGFSGDAHQRNRWFRALLASMVPIAVWWRHAPRAAEHDCYGHLNRYSMLAGHSDGDQVLAACAGYAQIARQRKQFQVQDPLSAQLVLMLDHVDRSPKLSSEERGASRAVSPDRR